MQIKVTRNKKKSKFPDLVKKLQALDNQKAKIGYFGDSGTHEEADMGYATLAFIHAFPLNGKHPTRNIFAPVKPMKGSRSDSMTLRGIIKPYLAIKSVLSADDVLTEVARTWYQKVQAVFGSSLLIVTQNPTPLVESEKLRDNLGWRTTINYTLRKV